jgi:GNAT superfamily N-acetyltransferase
MVRIATPKDALAIAILFHDTVRRINSRDYDEAQVQAWAGATPDPAKWRARQNNRLTFVEEENGVIRGFAELENDGHIGSVYVHSDHQGKGIASALLRRVEEEAAAARAECLWTEVSITARPFFARRGFETIAVQEVEYHGIKFRNYRMRKRIHLGNKSDYRPMM